MTLMSTHLSRRKASPFLKSQVKTLMMLCDKIESACDGDATGWSDSLVMDGTFGRLTRVCLSRMKREHKQLVSRQLLLLMKLCEWDGYRGGD